MAGETAVHEEEERHHLKVRRAVEGEAVRVLDGEGAVECRFANPPVYLPADAGVVKETIARKLGVDK